MKHSADLLGIARPIIALDDEYAPGFVDPMHFHHRTQILYASSGVMSVRTDKSTSVVPPQRAVWIPSGMMHEVSCRGAVSLRTLYIDATLGRDPQRCRVFEVSPFLRALILEVVGFSPNYDVDGREGRIVALMLEEVDRMPSAPYLVSMPDSSTRCPCCLVANPSPKWPSKSATTAPVLSRPCSIGRLEYLPASSRCAPALELLPELPTSNLRQEISGFESRYGSAGGRELDLFIVKASLSIEAVTAK